MSPRIIRQRLNFAAQPNAPGFEWRVYRNNPLTIQVGVFNGPDVDDLDGVTSITILARPGLTSGGNLFNHTVESADFTPLTAATWTDKTAQHLTFELASGDTNRAATAEGFVALHVVITALVAGEEVTLGIGKLHIYEDNNAADYPAPDATAGTQYLFGEISESGRSVIFRDPLTGDALGWCELMSGDAP